MKLLLILLVGIFISFDGNSQQMKEGEIIDEDSGEPIPQVHIQNISQGQYTVSSFAGTFQLPMNLGDSLWVSCVGYKSSGFIVDHSWDQSSNIVIYLVADTVLLDAVTISRIPTEYEFKERIKDYQPVDSSIIFRGMKPVANYDDKLLQNDHVKTIGFALKHPLGFAYHNLSRQRKEVRKAYELERHQTRYYKNLEKYNRDFVHELTNLEGDELTNFMLFCDFSQEWLAQKTQFQIAEIIKLKLEDYLAVENQKR